MVSGLKFVVIVQIRNLLVVLYKKWKFCYQLHCCYRLLLRRTFVRSVILFSISSKKFLLVRPSVHKTR
jgi:hypothetical protein